MKPPRPLAGSPCCPACSAGARAPPRAPGAARPLRSRWSGLPGTPAFNSPRSSRARPRRSPGSRGMGTVPSPPARGERGRGGRGWRPFPAHPRLLSRAVGDGWEPLRPPAPSSPSERQVGGEPLPRSPSAPRLREPISPPASPLRLPQARGASGTPLYLYICRTRETAGGWARLEQERPQAELLRSEPGWQPLGALAPAPPRIDSIIDRPVSPLPKCEC